MLEGCRFTPEQINQAACDIAKQVLGQDIVSKRTLHLLKFSGYMTFPCFVNNACRFFSKVAKENGTLVAGGITQTKAYTYQEVA